MSQPPSGQETPLFSTVTYTIDDRTREQLAKANKSPSNAPRRPPPAVPATATPFAKQTPVQQLEIFPIFKLLNMIDILKAVDSTNPSGHGHSEQIFQTGSLSSFLNKRVKPALNKAVGGQSWLNDITPSFKGNADTNATLSRLSFHFLKTKPTSLVIMTWNVNNCDPPPVSELVCLFKEMNFHGILSSNITSSSADSALLSHPPDLFAIGLQEVDLNIQGVMKGETVRSTLWSAAFQSALNQVFFPQQGSSDDNSAGVLGSFSVVAEKQFVGLFLVVYCLQHHRPAIDHVEIKTVGTGMMNAIGNKGGIAIRVKYYESVLCFVNAHLAAHQNKVALRNKDYREILNRTMFDPIKIHSSFELEHCQCSHKADENKDEIPFNQQLSLTKSNNLFFFGDLNYRIDMSTESVFDTILPICQTQAPPQPPTRPPPQTPIRPAPSQPPTASISPIVTANPLSSMQPSRKPRPAVVEPEPTPTIVPSKSEIVNILLPHDQLNKQRIEGKSFRLFEEGPITFLPTYKYEKRSVEYQGQALFRTYFAQKKSSAHSTPISVSHSAPISPGITPTPGDQQAANANFMKAVKKVRSPAWCDRILWFSGRGLEELGPIPGAETQDDDNLIELTQETHIQPEQPNHEHNATHNLSHIETQQAPDDSLIDFGDLFGSTFTAPIPQRPPPPSTAEANPLISFTPPNSPPPPTSHSDSESDHTPRDGPSSGFVLETAELATPINPYATHSQPDSARVSPQKHLTVDRLDSAKLASATPSLTPQPPGQPTQAGQAKQLIFNQKDNEFIMPIRQLAYQRADSSVMSDHRPVFSVFTVDAYVNDEERITHCIQERMKESDRTLNETIANTTLSTTELHFNSVSYGQSVIRELEFRNDGRTITANFSFVDPTVELSNSGTGSTVPPSPFIITCSPSAGSLPPLHTVTLRIKVSINPDALAAVRKMENGTHEQICIIHVEGGKDHFVSIIPQPVESCLGLCPDTHGVLVEDTSSTDDFLSFVTTLTEQSQKAMSDPNQPRFVPLVARPLSTTLLSNPSAPPDGKNAVPVELFRVCSVFSQTLLESHHNPSPFFFAVQNVYLHIIRTFPPKPITRTNTQTSGSSFFSSLFGKKDKPKPTSLSGRIEERLADCPLAFLTLPPAEAWLSSVNGLNELVSALDEGTPLNSANDQNELHQNPDSSTFGELLLHTIFLIVSSFQTPLITPLIIPTLITILDNPNPSVIWILSLLPKPNQTILSFLVSFLRNLLSVLSRIPQPTASTPLSHPFVLPTFDRVKAILIGLFTRAAFKWKPVSYSNTEQSTIVFLELFIQFLLDGA
ncbi:putative Inositol polyphosphate 5-phosphatase OCRL [Blattamonas nauphoetae]|uniref:Inositol polyphosphate 5-phosphatase OCRL n=1 Tax=Blattamonas nauphoetae TaxID=2049346 RepID=A0ABQ9XDV9_9EUKA|nr:putative Inositol polyphosphate 5-phosphatase OCRL [Blattamonas nauphoetae]